MIILEDVMNRLDDIEVKLNRLLALAGYTGGDAEVLALAEAPTGRHHLIGPSEGAILFGPDLREIVQPWEGAADPRIPLHSTCQCGRQIVLLAAGGKWQHCD